MAADTLNLKTMLTSEGPGAGVLRVGGAAYSSSGRSPIKNNYQVDNDYSPSIRTSTHKPHVASGMKPRGMSFTLA